MKIIHITDTHIVPEGETIQGLDPAERLSSVVDDVLRRHADADLVVITGDLTDRGDTASYSRLSAIIKRLNMPVRLMIGNHDDRNTFVECFPEHPRDRNGFIQSTLDRVNSPGRLLFLDTNEAGWSGGRYCDARLNWLASELEEAGDAPVWVFMHHPPVDLGVAHFEKIGLSDREKFLDTLEFKSASVRHIFAGHVHVPVNGTTPRGTPFTAGRSCNHQIILDFSARDCAWAAGSPNYGIITLSDRGTFVHAFDMIEAKQVGVGAYPPGP